MAKTPLFAGLVFDENGKVAESASIGNEPAYVIDDDGFKRHVPAEQIDRAVLKQFADMMKGSEEFISKETAKLMGQDDPFSQAIIQNQLKNIEQHFETILKTGLPEDMRAYLGMMGFKVVVNYRGEIVRVEQPSGGIDEDK